MSDLGSALSQRAAEMRGRAQRVLNFSDHSPWSHEYTSGLARDVLVLLEMWHQEKLMHPDDYDSRGGEFVSAGDSAGQDAVASGKSVGSVPGSPREWFIVRAGEDSRWLVHSAEEAEMTKMARRARRAGWEVLRLVEANDQVPAR